MSSVAVRNNVSTFIDALLAEDSKAIEQAAQGVISQAEDACELLGRISLIAMRGDSEGHAVLTLGAASMLSLWLIALRHVLGEDGKSQAAGVPLVVQALRAAAPAVKAGLPAAQDYPEGLFPSALPAGETVGSAVQKAVYSGDTAMVERLLFGLFGTGADYRTASIRIYDGISQVFQEGGHPLLCAVRGAQVLAGIEWGEDAPDYIHWLAPHLALHEEEPDWTKIVRDFLSEPQHTLASYRTRLAAPKNTNALPLRALLLSDASTPQVCQGVYDALIKNGASAPGVGSVIALAACDLLQNIGDDDRSLFERAAHGLLFASATRLTYTQVQEVEGLPLLFTAAAYVNALHKEFREQTTTAKTTRPTSPGGGLIAPALLESLHGHIESQNMPAALAIAHRYTQLGHDTRALFSVIGLAAASIDATADQGHALQIILAAGDEYMAWPRDLADTSIDGFLQVALRAAVLGKRG